MDLKNIQGVCKYNFMNQPSKASPVRKTQAMRRAETQNALLDAARALFVERGFAQTGLPEVVKKAGVTRGALYHHFEDKTDLFRAVATREAKAITETIDARTSELIDPAEAMSAGTEAYFDAMLVPGRAKILLMDAPSILGHRTAQMLTQREGSQSLRHGLERALVGRSGEEIDALTSVLSATFDRAALEIAQDGDRDLYTQALYTIVERLLAPANRTPTTRS